MDVLDALLGKTQIGRHELVEHRHGVGETACALRQDEWKWIDGHLYNLADDLSEQKDLAGQLPQKAAELRERLHAWRKSVDAAMPSANPQFKEKQ